MSAQGVWPAIFFLMASAWAWVMSPFLTSSSSVWPTAFRNAASTLLWVLPRSDAKCDTKLLHTVEALPGALGLGVEADAAGRKPTLRPGAEAVIQTAPAAMATPGGVHGPIRGLASPRWKWAPSSMRWAVFGARLLAAVECSWGRARRGAEPCSARTYSAGRRSKRPPDAAAGITAATRSRS